MTTGRFLIGLLAVWVFGFLLYSMHGLIHYLLIIAIIVLIVDRVGREAQA